MLKVSGLAVAFGEAAQPGGRSAGLTPVLSLEHWQLPGGAIAGIRGPSGAGKSTLLNVLSGLLLPQQGQVIWQDVELTRLGEGERDRWRRNNIGFIFQEFHLIPELSALENVLQPIRFDHWRCPPELRRRARELLSKCGLPRPQQLANSLSRGQQQRVAVARALIKNPPILLADEPTASLDRASADGVIELLLGAARAGGKSLVVVSHDEILLRQLDCIYELSEGQLVECPAL
ncbi:MAG: ATP-binding cassette domain-containing protein [Synechococcales cyanobacterium RM1_1_8]|nr:ATP-binding cassette domain-containing protein [Synechococcales cyanobacterium RM1_1_8]